MVLIMVFKADKHKNTLKDFEELHLPLDKCYGWNQDILGTILFAAVLRDQEQNISINICTTLQVRSCVNYSFILVYSNHMIGSRYVKNNNNDKK